MTYFTLDLHSFIYAITALKSFTMMITLPTFFPIQMSDSAYYVSLQYSQGEKDQFRITLDQMKWSSPLHFCRTKANPLCRLRERSKHEQDTLWFTLLNVKSIHFSSTASQCQLTCKLIKRHHISDIFVLQTIYITWYYRLTAGLLWSSLIAHEDNDLILSASSSPSP